MRDLAEFPYAMVRSVEVVGAHRFELETLDDFERTVAAVYRHLRGRGSAREQADLSPMFGVIWPTARALAARVAEEGTGLAGRRVLELGCGLALPSLVAARCGARVVASDQHPHTEALLARNLAHNGIAVGDGGVGYHHLDWREPDPALPAAGFDRVVASDVLFARELPDLVARTFARYLAPDGVGILTDPGRAWLDELVQAATAAGLSVEVDVDEVPRPDRVDEAFVIVLTRPPRDG